jgi:alkylation response protein AidB-like acyl-CoA dehydrogenase
MEMTISRDRWQQHLKSSGAYYRDQAAALDVLHQRLPQVGAGIAALAHRSLAEMMEVARVSRLTRNQHVLLRLGELVALTECSAALARRAARAADGVLPPKADRRFSPDALAAVSRVNARSTALKVVSDGLGLLIGAADGSDVAGVQAALGLSQILSVQAGQLADMDTIADALYGRG